MNSPLTDHPATSLAVSVAPEDLRRGDFVGVLSEIVEVPSYLWCESALATPDQMIRYRRLADEGGVPRRVKAICLPFVFVKLPSGDYQTIDLRSTELVRLDRRYAKVVWKSQRSRAGSKDPAEACSRTGTHRP